MIDKVAIEEISEASKAIMQLSNYQDRKTWSLRLTSNIDILASQPEYTGDNKYSSIVWRDALREVAYITSQVDTRR